MVQEENIQILIVGNSHEHVFTVLNYFKPKKVILVSSSGIKDSTCDLAEKIRMTGTESGIIWINPFTQQSIHNIINEILVKIKELREESKALEFYIGLTGGTNLMAIAAGFCAYILGLKGHYIVKDNNEILFFDPRKIVSSFP